MVLTASLSGTALAARKTGSNSQSGNAVWMVDWDEMGCDGGTVNTSDNYITDDGDWIGLWVKDTQKGLPDAWRLEDKGKFITSGTFWGGGVWYVCGTYSLVLFLFSNGEGTANSLTFTALQGGEVFASDSARFD